MYRSASTNRLTDDNFIYHSSGPESKGSTVLRAFSLEINELPIHEPLSEATKKEKSSAKFAENAIHIIPFVLLFCAFILWFFSNPGIDMQTKVKLPTAKIDGVTIEGDTDSAGTHTAYLPLELGDLESIKLDDYI